MLLYFYRHKQPCILFHHNFLPFCYKTHTCHTMRHTAWLTPLLLFLALSAHAQPTQDSKLLRKLLAREQDSLLNRVLQNPQQYQVQIIYTQINRDRDNKPHFRSHTFNLNEGQYFYPASTVKLPAAVAALEKLNSLQVPGLSKYSPLEIGSAHTGQIRVHTDSTAQSNRPSIAHYIKKVFLVSDNDAYNRLYEFVGQQRLNKSLHEKGITEARLLHRLSVGDGGERARHTNPFRFYANHGLLLYSQAAAYNPHIYPNRLSTTLLGKGYYTGGELVQKPMDFSDKNYISLKSLQEVLKAVMLPDGVAPAQRFNLKEEDYTFLYTYMGMLPRESDFPAYDTTYYDSYVKFLLFGDSQQPMPEQVRVFNKVGNAYGFVIDNAYVVDFEHQVEFLLSAVILANKAMIFNSDDYQYKTVALPFMGKLGRAIYKYELQRRRKHKPDLSRYKVHRQL